MKQPVHVTVQMATVDLVVKVSLNHSTNCYEFINSALLPHIRNL